MNLEIQLTISCGVAFFPQDAEDFETLHANVEYALEQAKKVTDVAALPSFPDKMHRETVEQFRLQEVLRESVANNCSGFSLVYQPLVNGETQEVYGAETLMRFYLPDGTYGFPYGIYSDPGGGRNHPTGGRVAFECRHLPRRLCGAWRIRIL